MTRLRGRSKRGERLVDKSTHGHWKTSTLIAALGVGGVRCSTLVDGAVNANVFEAFVEQVLVHELKPGEVVVPDNLSSHKRARVCELIEAAGAERVFLPPYSPDLAPHWTLRSSWSSARSSSSCGAWRAERSRSCGLRCSRCSTG